MAVTWSSISEQFTELIGYAGNALGMDPALASITVGAVLLMLVPSLRRRRKAARYTEGGHVAAGRSRSRRGDAPNPMDGRFAALRVDSEDPDAIPRVRRHFSGQGRSEPQHQLRRR